MKKLVFVLIGVFLFGGVCGASIQSQRIQEKVINQIVSVRGSSVSCYRVLVDAKNLLIGLNQTYGDELSSVDKTKLTDLFSNITTTITALNNLISGIDTNFPSIQ